MDDFYTLCQHSLVDQQKAGIFRAEPPIKDFASSRESEGEDPLSLRASSTLHIEKPGIRPALNQMCSRSIS